MPVPRRRRRRQAPRYVAVAVTLAGALLLGPAVAGAGPGCLLAPVRAPIADHFRAPECTWCPGNRGLEYRVPSGTPVRAAAAGTVSFAGVVAGTRYVVVTHADGLRATYGGLSSSHLRTGDRVPVGAVVGRSGERLHFGLRRGATYIDPEPLLGRPVGRPRLIPTDGTPARPAPPPRVRCGPGVAGQPAR